MCIYMFFQGAAYTMYTPSHKCKHIHNTFTHTTLTYTAIHEYGHYSAAKQANVQLAPPVFLPAGLGLLGSFGGINTPTAPVPNREALLKVCLFVFVCVYVWGVRV